MLLFFKRCFSSPLCLAERLPVVSVLSVLLLCLAPLPATAQSAQASAVQPAISSAQPRLLRGAFYFYYLDNNYHQALQALHRWRTAVPATAGETRIMEAAIYLALGLDSRALELYQQVEQQGDPASGDAWFHLARRWQENANWPQALASIQRALSHDDSLSAVNRQQALFIFSTSYAKLDKLAEAQQVLEMMVDDDIWTGLARYNWMIAAMRLNARSRDLEKLVEAAVFYLSEEDYESKALRDRILLVAGIYALETGKHRRAEAYFKEISQDSVFTAPALLHYGWALVEQWKYQQAMQPWRILQQKYNDFHPAVIESLLGVPHALELLNATTQSLKTYEMVEQRLLNMRQQIATLNDDEHTAAWLDRWLEQQQGQSWGWMTATLTDMPDSTLSRMMQSMLDDGAFNQQLAQLSDLNRLKQQLQQQQQDLQLWQQVIHQRQQHLQQLSGDQRLQQLEQRYQSLLRQVQGMQQLLHQEDQKVFAFASDHDQRNVERLSAVVPLVASLHQVADPTRELSRYKERWRRVRGLQLWQVYETKPQRRWHIRQGYQQLRISGQQLQQQLNNSRLALQWADSSWHGFPQRIRQAEARLAVVLKQVDGLYHRQRQNLRYDVDNYLQALDQRLTDYLAQTRLSIARLYDDALQQHVTAGGEHE